MDEQQIMNKKIEDNMVILNNRLNKQIKICANLSLSEKLFIKSVNKVNKIMLYVYENVVKYTSERPRKSVFNDIKKSLEILSKVDGFRPGDKNFIFDEFKQHIITIIDEILIMPAELTPLPTHTRSLSVRTPITRASAGGKTKTKTKTKTDKNKNKTNKKR
jgi:hypothetical protein